ncbi:hypothetical protein Cni_G22023 [Canna indica]|uniref:Homeobox domain-containing protein n=1 Tax=Canna indica TaxID=4628 RepID=A0AAQ3KR56_9LILI|nr:hypothetical protein Cni_G22023 [Canna indica]
MMAHEYCSTGFSPAGMQSFEHNHHHHAQQLFGGVEILGVPSSKPQPFAASHGHIVDHRFFPRPADHNCMLPVPEAAPPTWLTTDGAAEQLSLSLFDIKDGSSDHAAPQPWATQYGMAGGFQLPPQPLQLRNSRFLRPAQELLREFCSLADESSSSKKRQSKAAATREVGGGTKPPPNFLPSMDLPELQKMKSKLLSMLEEVDMVYRRYSEQMRTVVQSFEAVAGEGAARVYSTLASTAMSRHFRCLRDGILSQLGEVRKAIGEKDEAAAAPGATRRETPRLKLLDRCMRQHRAFQQGLMEPHPWRPQRGLPERAVSVLRAWLFEHFLHPYPNDSDKHILARQTGLSRSQVSNWFINARVRLWKPMVEEMYAEEMKEFDQAATATPNEQEEDTGNPNPNPDSLPSFDHKPLPPPLPEQHLIDSDSLTSIVHSNRHCRQVEGFDIAGASHMDFSYSGSNGSRTGVSLTLGLQHHNGGGMSLSMVPNSQQSDLSIDEDQHVHFHFGGGGSKPALQKFVGSSVAS